MKEKTKTRKSILMIALAFCMLIPAMLALTACGRNSKISLNEARALVNEVSKYSYVEDAPESMVETNSTYLATITNDEAYTAVYLVPYFKPMLDLSTAQEGKYYKDSDDRGYSFELLSNGVKLIAIFSDQHSACEITITGTTKNWTCETKAKYLMSGEWVSGYDDDDIVLTAYILNLKKDKTGFYYFSNRSYQLTTGYTKADYDNEDLQLSLTRYDLNEEQTSLSSAIDLVMSTEIDVKENKVVNKASKEWPDYEGLGGITVMTETETVECLNGIIKDFENVNIINPSRITDWIEI